MKYRFDAAKQEDLPGIEEIYAYARQFMARTGNPHQWGTSHPPVAQLKADIEQGKLFAVKAEGRLCGVFYFALEEDPTYGQIFEGGWHWDHPYGVIHRIASDGSGGILRAAVDFGFAKTEYLRIDTHEDNRVMQKALEKAGFQKCGIIYIADGSPRIAYDLRK